MVVLVVDECSEEKEDCNPNIQLRITVSGPINRKIILCVNGSPKQFTSVGDTIINCVDILCVC